MTDEIQRAKKAAYDAEHRRAVEREKRETTWGDVYWRWKRRGYPPEEAAHRADEWEKRRKAESYLTSFGPEHYNAAQ